MIDYKQFEISRIGDNGRARDILPVIDSNGDFKEVTGKDALIQSIRNLLMTPLGFYPFDPSYGSLLYKQLFELNDSITEESIKYEVKDRIEEFDDRVTVDSVNIKRNDKLKSVIVSLELKIVNDANRTKMSVYMKNLGDSILNDDDSLSDTIWARSES